MSFPKEPLEAILEDLVFRRSQPEDPLDLTDEELDRYQAALDRYQDFLGVEFPADYCEVAKRYSGLGEFGRLVMGRPRRFDTAMLVRVGEFIPIYGEPRECVVEFHRESLRLGLERSWPNLAWLDQLIPFANERSWQYSYCFDFAYDKGNPPIVWIDHQMIGDVEFDSGIEFVARDFREFLSLIVERYSIVTDADEIEFAVEDVREEKIEALDREPWVRSDEHRAWTAHRDKILGLS